jgi:serine/threonine-protein kinase
MKICHTCQQTYSDDVEFCPRDGSRLAAQPTATEAQFAAGLSRRYRIVRRLGQGGMGAVFLAEQITVGNRPVALKVLNRKLLDDPDFLLRFQNEAGSTGRIRHTNVVTIFESAQADDGTPYIAMEFLEGESLRQALKRRGALPLPEVGEILQQTARGLNAAHKLGIIHRDLKPDNIFLARGDEGELIVKVVDFGIAKLRESSTHTQTGMVLGTPAYMSYEQASGMRSEELDARSDIYSLGVVVYEMLTGRAPFHSDTPLGYVRKHMMEEPPPFRAVAPGLGVPPAVESAVMKALVKDRNQRYASVLDFPRDFARAATLPSPVESPKRYATTVRVEPAVPQGGAVREPPVLDPGPPVPPPVAPAAPVAAAPDVGASGARPEAERRSALHAPGRSALPPHWVPRSFEVGAGGEPPLGDSGARPQPKKRSTARIASLVAAVVVVIVVALAWVYWRGPAKPHSLQPGAPQQEARVPAKPQTPIPARGAGTVRENPKDGLRYVWIPPRTFMMGCSPGDNECGAEEKPPHQVTITKGFWMGQTPVTVGAYKRFAGAAGRQMPAAPSFNTGWTNENMPIVDVTWGDAQAYCGWMGGRLPTEAEWEYAARGGSPEARYGNLDEIAWYSQNSGKQTHDVAQKRPNGFGLYDMLGNVWEWVNDWYGQNYYQNSPSQDPRGAMSGQFRVLRGGSWGGDPRNVRVSVRFWYDPGVGNTDGGFRCGGEVFVPSYR